MSDGAKTRTPVEAAAHRVYYTGETDALTDFIADPVLLGELRGKLTDLPPGIEAHAIACLAEAVIYHLARDRDAARSLIEGPWEDKPDEWTGAIEAAHPMNAREPEDHERYVLALEMVGHRHSKGSLVALVNWLLRERDTIKADFVRRHHEALDHRERTIWARDV